MIRYLLYPALLSASLLLDVWCLGAKAVTILGSVDGQRWGAGIAAWKLALALGVGLGLLIAWVDRPCPPCDPPPPDDPPPADEADAREAA